MATRVPQAEQAQVWQRSRKGGRQSGHQVSAVHHADVSSHHGLEGLLEDIIAHPARAAQAHWLCVAPSVQQSAAEAVMLNVRHLYHIAQNWQQ